MKSFLFFCVFSISLSVFSQTEFEQNLYNNKIWKSVENSRGTIEFYNSNDIVLGYKKTTSTSVNYLDVNQRLIRSVQVNPNIKSVQAKKVKVKKANKQKSFVKVGNLYVKQKRNKATYYNLDGTLLREVKRRGSKVYYTNNKGKLIGYKQVKSSGIVEYRDRKGRKTGESFLNSSGFVVYESYRQRKTPGFMVSDAYFM